MSHFQDFSYSATKYFLIMLCCNLTLFYATNLNGQGKIFSEAPIVIKDGVTFSTMLYVKFNDGVIDLAKGAKQATIADIKPSFPYTIQFFKNLEAVYDTFTIYKAIPSAVWNENIIINRSTGKAVMLIDMSQLFIIGFPKLVPISQIISDLELLPEVAYAHPPIQAKDLLAPDDSYYANQWNLQKIDAPKAWDVTAGNSNVWIGIIEAHGVKRDHEDFLNLDQTSKFVAGKGDNTYDLDYDHGTMVAGIVGAATNNNKGVASLGWNVKMIPYHWTGWSPANMGNLPQKIHQAAIDDQVQILNCSFETLALCELDSYCLIPSNYQSVSEEILNALKAGVVVVAAVGNLSINHDNKECNTVLCSEGNVPYTPYPASYYFSKQQYPDLDEDVEVIGVSATDQSDVFTPGFNYGNFVDLSAPGMFVWTTRHDANGFPYYNNTGTGTSLATPHLAALAGLILSINPDLSIQQVQDIMERTSKDLGASGYDSYYGHGRINAYQAVLFALAYANKAPNISPTIYNNQRILARGQNNPATVLHEVFAAGVSESYEIFYRRSSNNGSSWDLTERLSAGVENNRQPCLTITDEGTPDGVHTVWQTKKANGKYKIYYRKSTNNGVSWGDPFLLADEITCSTNQSAGPMPVITSISYSSSYKLLVIWVSSTGLKYRTAYNDQWATTGALDDGSSNSYVWFPSLMGKGSWASLSYDTRFNGVYSRIFNGVWSSRTRVDQTTTIYDRASQIAITIGSETAAAWYARPSGGGNYRICFRMGTSYNTWNDQYQEFAHTNQDALYPAVTVYNIPQDYYYAVIYHTSDNQVRLQIKDTEGGNWSSYNPGSNNRFANISHVHLNTPKMIWTGNQSSATGPYPIELSQQYLPKVTATNNWVYHRRADIENQKDRTSLSLEWGEIEIVAQSGETLALEFVPCKQSLNLGLNASNVMDYLATVPVSLPAPAEQLRFHYRVFTSCERDSLNDKIVTDFTNFDVTFRLTDQTSALRYGITAHYSDANGAFDDQQDITVDVSQLAAAKILMKPELSGASVSGTQLSYSLGHIYIEPDKALPKPLPSLAKILEPETFALLQNYPNPFNPLTRIPYSIAETGAVSLKVYDLLGREVAILVKQHQPAGNYEVTFDGSHLVSGIYMYRLEAGSFVASKKLVLVR